MGASPKQESRQVPADLIGAGLVPAVAGFDLLGGVEDASVTGSVAPPLRASDLSVPASAVASTSINRVQSHHDDGGLSLVDAEILRQSVAVDCALADTGGIDEGIVTAFDLFEGVGDASKAGSVTNTPTQAPGFPARQGVVAPTLTACVQSHHKDGGLSLDDAEILL